jgi:multiple sugar transport system permease protein
VLLLLCVLFLAPVYWMVVTSVKPEGEAIEWPPTIWPRTFTFQNYRTLFAQSGDVPVFTWFRNSTLAATSYALLSVAICLLAGFGLARMEFPGKRLYASLLLLAMAIPGIILLLPSFVIVDFLGWTDTLYAIVLPHLGNTFGVLLFAQFMKKIPKDLEDAAHIDGATSLQVLWYVIMPNVRPVILTLLVLNFMGNWNDYFWPFITLYSPEMRTMPIGMTTLQGRYEHFYGSMTAGATLMALPSILLFLFVMKYYVRSITLAGALKE